MNVVSAESSEPEARHRACWYSRRTPDLPTHLGFHSTIEDGELLYCSHPMLFPVVAYDFDVRNCINCEYFKQKYARTTKPYPSDSVA